MKDFTVVMKDGKMAVISDVDTIRLLNGMIVLLDNKEKPVALYPADIIYSIRSLEE